MPLFFVVGRPSSSPSWLPHDCKLIAEEGGAGGAAVGGVPGLDVCGAEVAKLTEETVHFFTISRIHGDPWFSVARTVNVYTGLKSFVTCHALRDQLLQQF